MAKLENVFVSWSGEVFLASVDISRRDGKECDLVSKNGLYPDLIVINPPKEIEKEIE